MDSGTSGEVGYWIGYQSFEGTIGGRQMKMRIRITELFRLVDGAWKLFHRHADTADQAKKPG